MKRFVGFVFSVVLIVAGVFAFLHYQLIIDAVVASQYKPPAAVNELAAQIQFTEHGSFLFKATQAELDDSADFNQHCHKKDATTVVLGCYIAPQHTYIFDVKDPRLSGIRQVTAAHETLHAAYDRLSVPERQHVNQMIEAALPAVLQTKSDLAVRLEVYAKTEPGERDNELHSILGTEAATLPPELENYYAQYFKDRHIITTFAASYSKVFNDLKANQDALVTELKALNTEVDSLSTSYNTKISQLNADIQAFNAQAEDPSGFSSQAEFNARRSGLQVRQNQLERDRQVINDKISLYNQKRTELEALNVQVEELNSKIDSTKLPSL